MIGIATHHAGARPRSAICGQVGARYFTHEPNRVTCLRCKRALAALRAQRLRGEPSRTPKTDALLAKHGDTYFPDWLEQFGRHARHLEEDNGRLRAELAEYRRDAERYRRLCSLVAWGELGVCRGHNDTDEFADDGDMLDAWLDSPEMIAEAQGIDDARGALRE